MSSFMQINGINDKWNADFYLTLIVEVYHFSFLKIYNGFYHSLLLEPKEDKQRVQDDILNWLKKRI